MKTILVLGLGKFGSHVVGTLAEEGHVRLYALDKDERAVERFVENVHTAATGDLEDPDVLPEFLAKLERPDVAVVCLGERVNPSLIAALALREAGIPRILVKAVDESQRRVLQTIDRGIRGPAAFEVILPALDAAERLGRSLGSQHDALEIPLSSGYEVMELGCPPAIEGKTPAELDFRKHHNVTLIGYRRRLGGGALSDIDLAAAEAPVPADTVLVLIGPIEDLRKLAKGFALS